MCGEGPRSVELSVELAVCRRELKKDSGESGASCRRGDLGWTWKDAADDNNFVYQALTVGKTLGQANKYSLSRPP